MEYIDLGLSNNTLWCENEFEPCGLEHKGIVASEKDYEIRSLGCTFEPYNSSSYLIRIIRPNTNYIIRDYKFPTKSLIKYGS